MHSLTYDFTELPVFAEYGFQAGTIDGHAEITFNCRFDWRVGEISIDADNGMTGERCGIRRVFLASRHPLAGLIFVALTATRKSQIEDAIALHLAAQVDDIADARRLELVR